MLCCSAAKAVGLLGLVAVGLAGGAYLSGAFTADPPPDPAPQTPSSVSPFRFPLSAADARDTLEAPELAVDSDGRVLLAFASQTADAERTLFLASSHDRGANFSAPRAAAKSGIFKSVSQMKGKEITREIRLVPHLAAGGKTLALSWIDALPQNAGVRLAFAESTDGGTTFSTPISANAGAKSRPTFTAMAVGPNGELACSWLDNRGRNQAPYAAVRPAGAAAFEPESLVYAGEPGKGTCPCCPTAVCFGPDGTLFVAFRNVDDGYRDIAIGRKKPGASQFEGPFPVESHAWKFDGCPHDGASIAVANGRLHAVWMDARSGRPRCNYGSAPLDTLKFETREIDTSAPGTQGNAKLAVDATGGLHLVWEESLGASPESDPKQHNHAPPSFSASGGRAIRYAVSPKADGTFTPPCSVAPRPGAYQTRPAVAVAGDGVAVVAWQELDESGKAVVATRVAP